MWGATHKRGHTPTFIARLISDLSCRVRVSWNKYIGFLHFVRSLPAILAHEKKSRSVINCFPAYPLHTVYYFSNTIYLFQTQSHPLLRILEAILGSAHKNRAKREKYLELASRTLSVTCRKSQTPKFEIAIHKITN